MQSHVKGVITISNNTLGHRGNLNCLRAILPSENLPCADAAGAHIQASVILYLGTQAAYVLTGKAVVPDSRQGVYVASGIACSDRK